MHSVTAAIYLNTEGLQCRWIARGGVHIITNTFVKPVKFGQKLTNFIEIFADIHRLVQLKANAVSNRSFSQIVR